MYVFPVDELLYIPGFQLVFEKNYFITHFFLGFLGNSNNLHRIIVDDFTDSMKFLLMVREQRAKIIPLLRGQVP